MKISPARTAAFDVLLRIEKERSFSSVVLPLYEERLNTPDRGLCHEIVLGVLRRQIYLDRVVTTLAPYKKLDLEVLIALRLGLYQLLFLERIPDHAIVNESVALVSRAKKTSAKGLVNAVLRRATGEIPKLSFADDIERVSVETSHPRWLIERWICEFGAGETEKLAVANNKTPRIAFRATAKLSDSKLSSGASRSELVEGCFLADSIDADLRALAERGEIYFQDEASQMVAAAIEVPAGGSFFDVCAAPGGKTAAIAMRLTANDEKRSRQLLIAGDLYHRRAKILRENLIKQVVDFVDVVQYDAADALPFVAEAFDTVLVDAPCSGTGTIRHNPEIRYFLSPEDFKELQTTQLAILRNASKLVKPGGTLIYSTCSLEREENEEVCYAFLEDFRVFGGIKPKVPDRFVTAEGFARTFPHRDNMDGFFIAAFLRV